MGPKIFSIHIIREMFQKNNTDAAMSTAINIFLKIRQLHLSFKQSSHY